MMKGSGLADNVVACQDAEVLFGFLSLEERAKAQGPLSVPNIPIILRFWT